MQALGKQILLELYQCEPALLDKTDWIEMIMLEAANLMKATVVMHQFHQFSPHGVSGVVVIQESHLAIHTWPEFGYAAIDIFTCGESLNPSIVTEFLKLSFKATQISIVEIMRGNPDLLKPTHYKRKI
jgi:spermidine synthase